jgi:cell division protein FtsL
MEKRPVRPELIPWSYPLLGFVVVSVLLVLYLCQFAQIVSSQYKMVALKETRKTLLRQQQDLELSVQRLTSLERVESVATKRLGMVLPELRETLDVGVYAAKPRDLAVVSARP